LKVSPPPDQKYLRAAVVLLMATQIHHAQVITNVSQPLNEPPTQELGMNEKFYRYFQEEVTGTTTYLKYRRRYTDTLKYSRNKSTSL
jgi:hypothetical protein